MKSILLFVVVSLTFLNCVNTSNSKPSGLPNDMGSKIDSSKWFFYAYTFKGIAAFNKDQKEFDFRPIECDIDIDSTRQNKDTLHVLFSFEKGEYKYSHIYEGLMVFGILHYGNIFKPLTGGVILDHFDNPSYIENDNHIVDSAFRAYLHSADTIKLSGWLFKEAKRRNVW